MVTGTPLYVILTYLNGPTGQPVVIGQLQKNQCGSPDGCRPGTANEVYVLSKQLNLPIGQAQFQISATGANGQVLSPVISVLSLSTPLGFTVSTGLLTLGGPLDYTNFSSKYVQGGILPNGGANINVTTVPLPTPPLDNYIDIQLAGTTITSRVPLIVSGVACTEIVYSVTFYASLSYSNEVIYCPSGKSLYRFELSYNAGDPNESQSLSSFQQVVSNAQFAP
jgi:hypothetical protein